MAGPFQSPDIMLLFPHLVLLHQIRVADDFWGWTNDILIPAVFPANDTVPIIDEDRLVQDGGMYLTGPVRFRQLRIQSEGMLITSVILFHVKNVMVNMLGKTYQFKLLKATITVPLEL